VKGLINFFKANLRFLFLIA